MGSFQKIDWLENFRMGEDTFMYICNKLGPHIRRQYTVMRQPIPVEKRIAISLWRLARNVNTTHWHSFIFGLLKSELMVQEGARQLEV